ncbi:PAS domain-containing protein [Muricauda sp. SCSIO 64092]|uniref:PAS domain-containing sensor histidine kinase n=1 Tax=Allomuricauda sp. SCSIO 64092 TaxID=2908842 RepID=UPI001FF3F791|nr:PAS domain-containing protein [Muricauda sp. SCSIO 64092]UOY07445.1 PAS domain-containing protein [Muricauda sp. SCSIO 64092]
MKALKTDSFSYFVRQLPQPIAFVDTSFRLVGISDKWLEYFEFPQQKKTGTSIFHLYGEKINTPWKNSFESCLNGNTEYGIQTRITSTGKENWYEWTNIPWYDEEENVIGVIGKIEDITKKVENEMKYEKLENLLKDQSEITKVGTWEYNIGTDTLTWSPMTKKIHEVTMNYKPNVETAIDFYQQGHSRNTIAMLIHNGIHRGESWSKKLRIETAKGNGKWIIAAGKPLYKNGRITRLIGTIQDVTEQVEQETKTKESEELLRTLIDNLPLNLYIKDLESRKVLVNKSECDYLGVQNQEEIIGKTDFELYDERIAQISRDEDLHVIKTQKPIIGKRTISIKRDGTATSFLTSKIPWLNGNGESKGLIGISIDISELVQKENQLSNLINVTAIQNKKLINFAHIVSHNLRSHAANFSMLLNFLGKEDEETEKKNILKMLTKASDNLMNTLENLNEVVHISTNVNLEKKPINLNGQITKVQENLAVFLQQKNAKIVNTISDKVYVNAVPAYLESILLNLLTNSVKYKHPDRDPEIILSTKKEEDQIVFSVKDNGLGIDMDKYGRKLFGMYKTFHNNSDARGIGLYITKNQIEAMGGSIVAHSQINKGSTFNVYFKDET